MSPFWQSSWTFIYQSNTPKRFIVTLLPVRLLLNGLNYQKSMKPSIMLIVEQIL